jgi:hypothetical protein
MLSDGVFLLGLTVVALGFVSRRDLVVVLGVAVAALGRQSAVPLAIGAAIAILVTRKRSAGRRTAAITVAVGVGVFVAELLVARSFSSSNLGGVTSIRSFEHPIRLVTKEGIVGSDARAFLALLVPMGLIAGAWLRGSRPALVPVLLAASVIVQPLALAQGIGHNETRLAALAIPALVVVAACQLRGTEVSPATTGIVILAILLASFHARYSSVGMPSSAAWAAVSVIAAISTVIALGWPRLTRGRKAADDSASRATFGETA